MTGFVIAAARLLLELLGALFIVIVYMNRRTNQHGRTRRRNEPQDKGAARPRRIEFSKLVLSAVLLTYFFGFAVGTWAVTVDVSQLGVFLTYVGTPTGMAIGFYAWKAKAENIVKIKRANPEETDGAPVDLTSIQ